jgi:hypothetical protein
MYRSLNTFVLFIWHIYCFYAQLWVDSYRATQRGSTRAARRQGMDGSRFDTMVALLAETGSSRRSLLGRLAGGGLAAALAALGIGGFNAEDGEAASKRRCLRRCKKKDNRAARRQCKKKCRRPKNRTTVINNNSQVITGFVAPTGPGGTCTVAPQAGCPVGATCVVGPAGLNICIVNPTTPVGGCTSDAQCASGRCDVNTNTCVVCPMVCGTPGAPVCCILGTQCLTDPGGSLVCL